jgi:hypothetical protein
MNEMIDKFNITFDRHTRRRGFYWALNVGTSFIGAAACWVSKGTAFVKNY